jgi:hypothetical protein
MIKNIYKNRFKKLFQIFIYLSPLFIGLYLHIGKIFFFSQGSIHATDLETPLNPLYYFWNIICPWNPLGLGSEASFSIFDFIYGSIAASSFGNPLISQLLVLSLPPIIAYFGVFLITRKILNLNIYGCILASFFYAFAPPYLAWFSLPYMLGFSLLPLLLYLVLKIVICATTDDFSLKRLIPYTLSIAIILSLMTNIYFHSLPFIVLSFAIVSIFAFKGEKREFNKKYITRIFSLLALIMILYMVVGSLPRLFEMGMILTDPQRQALILRTGDPSQILESIKVFYKEATLSNIVRLGGGTPINERYIFLNSNPIGYILPIFVFLGALFTKKLSTRAGSIYLASVVNSILILTMIVIFRRLALADNQIVTNFIFSGVRRPERFLELLSLFYAIGLAFTFTRIQMFLRSIKVIKNSKFPHIKKKFVAIAMLVLLILIYIPYTGLLSNPSHPTYAQFFAPRPKDFNAVEDFLNNDNFQTSTYNASYRYTIVPSYVQINAYTRYNYPNFFYASSFSTKDVQEFVATTNNMIADQDPAAIIPLNLASVKYIAILPQSFAQDELQSWRLNGTTRSSGVNLFGDINDYLNFTSKLPQTELIYKNKVHVFDNKEAYPRVYVPNMLVWAQGNMKDVFKALKMVDSISPLSDFALVINQSEDIKDQSFVIDDFGRQTRIKTTSFNLMDLNFNYTFNREVELVSEKSIIVWSQQKSISMEGNIITLSGTVPADQQAISIWVSIPPTNLTDTPKLRMRLLVNKDMQDKIVFSIMDQDGKPLLAKIEKTISSSTDDEIYLDVLITPTNSNPTWFKMVLQGSPGSTLEIALENQIEFEQLVSLDLCLVDMLGSGINQNNFTFPMVIYTDDNMTVLWPTDSEEGLIKYMIDTPIELEKASLFIVSTSEIDGWSKVNEDVKWLSPVDISVNLEVSPLIKEKGNDILIPIFFGNAYDTSWKLYPTTKSGNITKVVHALGNGFGNLWLVNVSGLSSEEKSIHLTFEIQMDKLELYTYQIYAFTSVTLLLLLIPLYIIEVKYNKSQRRYKSP